MRVRGYMVVGPKCRGMGVRCMAAKGGRWEHLCRVGQQWDVNGSSGSGGGTWGAAASSEANSGGM